MSKATDATTPRDQQTAEKLGARVRWIRQRRAMSQQLVADQVGISKPYLSMLENGHRDLMVTRRGMIEDLAAVLGCSPMDILGRPALADDPRTIVAASAVPALLAALHDTTLEDAHAPAVPNLRPLPQLVHLTDVANDAADQVRYEPIAGSGLGDLILELHVYVAKGKGEERQTALETLVTACIVARSLAGSLGESQLAITATRRGWDAARMAERSDLEGLMAMGRAISLNRVGSRSRANLVIAQALSEAQARPGPVGDSTSEAEARGMLHLTAAHLAARDGSRDVADLHLAEARDLARVTGERNFMRYHFGPANVAAWELAVAVETARGPETAERLAPVINLAVFQSADRVASWHFDMARAFAQAEGERDREAIREMDRADQLAAVRLRQDPLAIKLVESLDHRVTSRARPWELDSLRNRYGVA